MNTKQQDIQKLKSLSPMNGNCQVFWFEGGGGDVYRIFDTFYLNYVTAYGGNEYFEGAFEIEDVEKLVDLAHTWT